MLRNPVHPLVATTSAAVQIWQLIITSPCESWDCTAAGACSCEDGLTPPRGLTPPLIGRQRAGLANWWPQAALCAVWRPVVALCAAWPALAAGSAQSWRPPGLEAV